MKRFDTHSRARLMAVQALYQAEQTGAGSKTIVSQFQEHGTEIEGEVIATSHVHMPLFARVFEGAVEHNETIDRHISEALAKGWALSRLDATVRAVMRAGTYEIVFTDTPHEILIDDYLDLAKGFVEAQDVGFVNAALDHIVKATRTEAQT